MHRGPEPQPLSSEMIGPTVEVIGHQLCTGAYAARSSSVSSGTAIVLSQGAVIPLDARKRAGYHRLSQLSVMHPGAVGFRLRQLFLVSSHAGCNSYSPAHFYPSPPQDSVAIGSRWPMVLVGATCCPILPPPTPVAGLASWSPIRFSRAAMRCDDDPMIARR